MTKRIGFDLDGVLSQFNFAFADLLIDITKMNFLGDFRNDPNWPPVWHWPQEAGYTKSQTDETWKLVDESGSFWAELEPLPGVRDLNQSSVITNPTVETYFITHRSSSGLHVKEQTEYWLYQNVTLPFPTVLLSGHKGSVCAALDLDCYVDDKLDNIESVMFLSPCTRAYLLDAPYNRQGRSKTIMTVGSVKEFLDREGL